MGHSITLYVLPRHKLLTLLRTDCFELISELQSGKCPNTGATITNTKSHDKRIFAGKFDKFYSRNSIM